MLSIANPVIAFNFFFEIQEKIDKHLTKQLKPTIRTKTTTT